MPQIKHHFQRFEIKYQIPSNMVEKLIPEFLKYMNPDPFAKNLPNSFYTVASLYYDSVGFGAYYQKLAGVKTRKKIRLRFYPSDNNYDINSISKFFLEIKRKNNMVIIKDRLDLNYFTCYNLLRKNQLPKQISEKNDQAVLDEFMWLKNYNNLNPKVLVVYDRKPFISKVDPNFRVTLDYNIRACKTDWIDKNPRLEQISPGTTILEVKFNNILPAWFHFIIQKCNLEYQPFSKYCTSLEKCYPHLTN